MKHRQAIVILDTFFLSLYFFYMIAILLLLKIGIWYFYSFFLILSVFVLDRLTKAYVIKLIENNEKELFINDFLNITLNWNRGIGFGLLSFEATTVYHLISALILLIIIYLIYLMVRSDSAGKLIIDLA